jgi:hypothetical protein
MVKRDGLTGLNGESQHREMENREIQEIVRYCKSSDAIIFYSMDGIQIYFSYIIISISDFVTLALGSVGSDAVLIRCTAVRTANRTVPVLVFLYMHKPRFEPIQDS